MKWQAPAKVNLSLHITGKREDGFHSLSSLVAFTEFGDVLDFQPSGELDVRFIGPFSSGLNIFKNSIIDAVRWFETYANIQVKQTITVEKNIPVMAGLGGGTADCAATILALCKIHSTKPPEPAQLAKLGADVPVSFFAKPALMEGIGEIIYPTSLSDNFGIVLVNPRRTISTKAVFEKMDHFDQPIEYQNSYSLNEICSQQNSMEASAIKICPEISELIRVLGNLETQLVRMTGSGATVFALTQSSKTKALAQEIQGIFPNYWVLPTQIRRSTT